MNHTEKEYGRQLAAGVESADAILVGAGSGMSSASGFDFYYRADDTFWKYMRDFHEKYGYEGTFDGFYYPYPDEESRWAFIARSSTIPAEAETGQTYKDIAQLLAGKNYHVLTTNQDFQFTRAMPEEKISAIQGDLRYLQCGKRCHDGLYEAQDIHRQLNDNIDENLRVPTELIPR